MVGADDAGCGRRERRSGMPGDVLIGIPDGGEEPGAAIRWKDGRGGHARHEKRDGRSGGRGAVVTGGMRSRRWMMRGGGRERWRRCDVRTGHAWMDMAGESARLVNAARRSTAGPGKAVRRGAGPGRPERMEELEMDALASVVWWWNAMVAPVEGRWSYAPAGAE